MGCRDRRRAHPAKDIPLVQQSFIAAAGALDDAASLIRCFGPMAAHEAAARAEQSRGIGNVQRFCRWRQAARLIDALTCEEATGTIH